MTRLVSSATGGCEIAQTSPDHQPLNLFISATATVPYLFGEGARRGASEGPRLAQLGVQRKRLVGGELHGAGGTAAVSWCVHGQAGSWLDRQLLDAVQACKALML